MCDTKQMPRALLSVYDKTGVVELASSLHGLGWELLSSGGTAKVIADAGIPVVDVAEITGFPAILGHRVVTLHPAIHGALLADTNNPEHLADMATHGIEPIALAVVNLYPFSSQPSIELIDVGGPAMVRAAAKNFEHVAVITNPTQYTSLVAQISEHGEVPLAQRKQLAAKAYAMTAAYDMQVAQWMLSNDQQELPEELLLHLVREESLRYGENPHQRGARYRVLGQQNWWSSTTQHGGKEMSYLNVLDAEAAWNLVWRFERPCVVIVKHAIPCGLAIADTIEEAYRKALACDPTSAFGGIVATNRCVTDDVAEQLSAVFTEVVVAPQYELQALKTLQQKKNLRILEGSRPTMQALHIRSVQGGALVQDHDDIMHDVASWRVMSKAQPSAQQLEDALVAWTTCAAVTSNAIVIAKDGCAIGIGGGQQNRIDAAGLACQRAGDNARGGVAASDAFFPFRDGPDLLAEHGIAVIVQPGGSQRDDESIASADEHGIVLLFTDKRHFKH
jgi:phosphoribosylaminoimidazolecarboxamide formyltransferase/IMP cyclohydrolase